LWSHRWEAKGFCYSVLESMSWKRSARLELTGCAIISKSVNLGLHILLRIGVKFR
jgi:hypothetical protein